MRNCDKCGKELVQVFPGHGRRSTDPWHYEDALVIELHGGYGMFFDDRAQKLILCDECAHEFFDNNQWAVTPELDWLIKEDEEPSPNTNSDIIG